VNKDNVCYLYQTPSGNSIFKKLYDQARIPAKTLDQIVKESLCKTDHSDNGLASLVDESLNYKGTPVVYDDNETDSVCLVTGINLQNWDGTPFEED